MTGTFANNFGNNYAYPFAGAPAPPTANEVIILNSTDRTNQAGHADSAIGLSSTDSNKLEVG